jgi:hypothetical protein
MGGCLFPVETIISTQNFKLSLDVDQCEVESHRFCEITVSGPGRANRLVIITGIAVPAADTNSPDPLFRGDIFVKTDFIITPPDEFLNIVDGNQNLLQATYVTLADINNESEGSFIFAVDEASTQRNVDGRIQVNIRAAMQGDVTLARVAYQASILFHKAG